jgi:hypothetical protein
MSWMAQMFRVVEGGGGAGLALEQFHRARVLRHLGGKELQRDAAAEAQVLRLVNDAHPAAAQLLEDAVVGDDAADQGGHALGTEARGL